jgi:DNA-damage-inducible protein D
MEGTKEYTEKIFEEIKHIDENGREYWEARELQVILDYKRWQKFQNVIKNAKTACEQSKFIIDDHFTQVGKMINLAKGAVRKIKDYKLSRYACYLIVQNADSSKEVVALGQTYFAIQTRKQELSEKEYSELTEDEKRFYQRNLTKKGNYSLNITARNCGVKNFDKFHNCGYKGLYNGETANDIAKRKGLRYREDILDNMGSEELVANLFRISQTEAKLKKDNVKTEIIASATHYEVGEKVRRAIKDIGGTMPENLPTPDKSLKELKKENKKFIEYDLTEKS